jgi:hypothetical protein
MYLRRVLNDMELNRTAKTSGRKDGAVQVLRGIVAGWANSHCQSTKRTRSAMEPEMMPA